jgi:hypothetical protein
MWNMVDSIVNDAEFQVQLKLNSGDRRYVKQVVVWKLIDVTQLPVDLASHPGWPLDFSIAPLPDELEIRKAIARLVKELPQYRTVIITSYQ